MRAPPVGSKYSGFIWSRLGWGCCGHNEITNEFSAWGTSFTRTPGHRAEGWGSSALSGTTQYCHTHRASAILGTFFKNYIFKAKCSDPLPYISAVPDLNTYPCTLYVILPVRYKSQKSKATHMKRKHINNQSLPHIMSFMERPSQGSLMFMSVSLR